MQHGGRSAYDVHVLARWGRSFTLFLTPHQACCLLCRPEVRLTIHESSRSTSELTDHNRSVVDCSLLLARQRYYREPNPDEKSTSWRCRLGGVEDNFPRYQMYLALK